MQEKHQTKSKTTDNQNTRSNPIIKNGFHFLTKVMKLYQKKRTPNRPPIQN